MSNPPQPHVLAFSAVKKTKLMLCLYKQKCILQNENRWSKRILIHKVKYNEATENNNDTNGEKHRSVQRKNSKHYSDHCTTLYTHRTGKGRSGLLNLFLDFQFITLLEQRRIKIQFS